MRIPSLSLLILTVSLAACSKPSEPAAAATATAEPPPAAPAASGDEPATATKSAQGDATQTAGGLVFSAPKPFVSRAPKSSMRAAEYGIEGEPQSELAVFYFGPDQGGSVDANMVRWIGQFKKPDGTDAEAKRGERTVHTIQIATVEASGKYGGGMAPPGAPPPAAIDDAMLLGAIAKGPQGSVFFKLVGPRANVEGARSAFDQLLESIRAAQ